MRELDRFRRGALPSWSAPRVAFVNRMSEGRDPGLRAPEDQGVDVVSALICVHRLEVHAVADDAVLVPDDGGPLRVAGDARDVERLAPRAAPESSDHLRRRPPV